MHEKVVLFMHDFAGGGVERMRLVLAEGLSRRGARVTVIVQDESGPLRAHVPPGIAVIALSARSVAGQVAALSRLLRRMHPHILVASLDHNNIVALLAGMLSLSGTRIFICQHNNLSAERVLGPRYRWVPVMYRLLSPWAAGIVAVSDGVADDLARCTGIDRHRIVTIYNPVIDVDFPVRAAAPAPHPWLATSGMRVFVFAGRLVPQKDPEMLLRAFSLLRDLHARLIVIGDGPQRVDLEKQARLLGLQDRVYFTGFQANPLAWIAKADGLVLTSRYEGFGNVIVEALGCGVPVIATDCESGPSEILAGGRYGTLVKVGDVEALAAAFAGHRKADFPAEVLRGRAAAFTADKCVERHIALFRNRPGREGKLFGLRFAPWRVEHVVGCVLGMVPSGGAHLVVTPNADHIRLLRGAEFADACSSADIVCADGFPVALYAWARGVGRFSRVTGCDILHDLVADEAFRSHRVFILVEAGGTAAAVLAWASRHALTGQVVARVAPRNFLQNESAQRAMALDAARFRATILIVTLGAPVSETFVHRQRPLLPPCWALCVGQAMRVELGLTTRAPVIFRRLGMEWLYRMLHEPKRLAGRYVKSAAWFPLAIAIDLAMALQAWMMRSSPRFGSQ